MTPKDKSRNNAHLRPKLPNDHKITSNQRLNMSWKLIWSILITIMIYMDSIERLWSTLIWHPILASPLPSLLLSHSTEGGFVLGSGSKFHPSIDVSFWSQVQSVALKKWGWSILSSICRESSATILSLNFFILWLRS